MTVNGMEGVSGNRPGNASRSSPLLFPDRKGLELSDDEPHREGCQNDHATAKEQGLLEAAGDL